MNYSSAKDSAQNPAQSRPEPCTKRGAQHPPLKGGVCVHTTPLSGGLVQSGSVQRSEFAERVRESLAKADPNLALLAESLRTTFGARMTGLDIPTEDGRLRLGALSDDPAVAERAFAKGWPEGQR